MREEVTESAALSPELLGDWSTQADSEAEDSAPSKRKKGKKKSALRGGKKKGKKKKAKVKKVVEITYPDDFVGLTPPASVGANRRYGNLTYTDRWDRETTGLMHIPGVSHNQDTSRCEIMFISPQVLQEEMNTRGGTPASMLKGAPGTMFCRNLQRAGFNPDTWYYTSVVKYFKDQAKFSRKESNWGWPALLAEIRAVRPLLIVCMGKKVFDLFCPHKLNADDVQGAFFWEGKFQEEEGFNFSYCLMDVITRPLQAPEHIERCLVDLKNIQEEWQALRGTERKLIPVTEYYLTSIAEFRQLSAHLRGRQITHYAVDCEWSGQTFIDGTLRMYQFAWADGEAAVLHFYDEDGTWMWDCDIEEIKAECDILFNPPDVRFIGHAVAADNPWMKWHLGINTKGRVAFDTMFAKNTCHEGADLKLERMSVQYTDRGRYDIELTKWKKMKGSNFNDEDGYGRVPDKILLPYACNDVIVTFRMWPILDRLLEEEKVREYYYSFVLPFVDIGFGEMMEAGLPIGIEFLDEMRRVYNRNVRLLSVQMRKELQEEAESYFASYLTKTFGKEAGEQCYRWAKQIFDQHLASFPEDVIYTDQDLPFAAGNGHEIIREHLQSLFPDADSVAKALDLFDHWWCTPAFKVNSTAQIRRWLYQVKGFIPLKTTKKDGIQMGWEKIMDLPPDKQLQYQPAADKQTLKVFAEEDAMVGQLQNLKGVQNIVKAFLPEVGEDGKERGLHKWIQKDHRVHANFSLTETGRPRSWKPNILNWPKYITKPIEAAFERANKLDPSYEAAPSSLRASVQAPEGWVFVDMDLKTAEIFALAYSSGDQNMINVLTEPDHQFAFTGSGEAEKKVRIAYNENSSYPETQWDQGLFVSPEQVNRREDGTIIHPRRDLHWELGESVAQMPR